MGPRRSPAIGFAHRGARADAPENTLEAFHLALALGATGLESDVWLTADGVPVLDHDGRVRFGGRRRPIRELPRAALPPHVPSLGELYASCGADYELSLDLKDAAAAPAVVAEARRREAPHRLWLCHPDWRTLAGWRERWPDVRLVDSTRLRRVTEGVEARAARLARAGIDALNLHHSEWTEELAALLHRFGRCAFAWDLQRERELRAALRLGVDAVYSDHVPRMMAALARG